MAMFNFDYNLIQNLNTFNYINKERYLSWKDNTLKFRSIYNTKGLISEFKPIFIKKMPSYCNNVNLGEYSLDCTTKIMYNNCIEYK
jgi:capsule polysaccharide export protein KpsE/RkpR